MKKRKETSGMRAEREILADFSRTCEGCEHVKSVPWPVKGSYSKETVAYRCFAPGPRQGYHIGTSRFLPYIPAWCPEMEARQGEETHNA